MFFIIGNNSSGGGSSFDDSELQQKIKDIAEYGQDVNPYPQPTTLEKAKTQAKAQVEKKRQDYVYSKQSKRAWAGDDNFELNYYNAKQVAGQSLTASELDNYNKILGRLEFLKLVNSEADNFETSIDSAIDISSALTISTNAIFITLWGSDLDD